MTRAPAAVVAPVEWIKGHPPPRATARGGDNRIFTQATPAIRCARAGPTPYSLRCPVKAKSRALKATKSPHTEARHGGAGSAR